MIVIALDYTISLKLIFHNFLSITHVDIVIWFFQAIQFPPQDFEVKEQLRHATLLSKLYYCKNKLKRAQDFSMYCTVVFFFLNIYICLLLFSPFLLSNIPSMMIEMNACELSWVHHVERCSKSNILNVRERKMWRNCETIKLWTQHFHNNFITLLRCHAVNDR